MDIKVLRDSFALAKPIGPQVIDKFYEILWTDYPASKSLFAKSNMAKQKAALLNSLVFVVDHLDDAKGLTDYLSKMGSRHVKYGAQDEHYAWVGSSLLKAFAFFFKDKWTKDLEREWTEAYGFIAETMKKGAKSQAA